jgi:superfamily II DNA or RNA helicase
MNLQNLYDLMGKHQKSAIDAMSGQIKGQIIMPTGVGKTWVQVYKILETLFSTDTGIAVIAAHRLLLCEQLIKELLKRAFDFGLEGKFDVLTVACEGIDIEDVSRININCRDLLKKCNISLSTKADDIKNAVSKAKSINRHLLVVSTYQSLERLSKTSIDIACFDEAHEVTKGDKHDAVGSVLGNCKQAFFFTATPIHCRQDGVDDVGRGMDNEEFYGKELIQISPREAIDEGNILPPIVHTIKLVKGKSTDHNVIKAAFLAHREKILKYSHGKIGPKLLISTQGVEDMISLVKNDKFCRWSKDSGFPVIAFSSKGYFLDGDELTRKSAISFLQNLDDEESAIILHYDILTEGIDLPNITGILPLRELNKVKFLQTAGRAARLQKEDRKLLQIHHEFKTYIDENNNVIASKVLIKPVFWIIQNPLLNDIALETNESLIKIIREAYEVNPEFRDFEDTSTSSEIEESDDVLETPKTDYEEKYAEFIHDFEDEAGKQETPPTAQEKIHSLYMKDIDELLDMLEQNKITIEEFDKAVY